MRVLDPETFTEVVGEVVDRFPDQWAAARALGVDQSRISQLVGGHVGESVTEALRKSLRRHCGDPELQARLDGTILSPTAHAALERYASWIDSHVTERKHPGNDVYEWLLNVDEDSATWEAYFTAFRRKCFKRGFDADKGRVNLAILHALEPLAVGWRTAGIERTVQELKARGQLESYLTAALKREEILLRRTADPLRRAQEVTAERRRQRHGQGRAAGRPRSKRA